MKLDQFQQIQIGSLFRGLTRLSQKEVLEIYSSRSLPLHYVEGHLRGVSTFSPLLQMNLRENEAGLGVC